MTGNKTSTRNQGKYKQTYPKNKTTLAKFYDRYPYKKRKCNTCLPYVPKEEESDHKFALTYNDWKDIILIYFKWLCMHLLSGRAYRFSGRMGEFQIVKYKSNKKNHNVDMNKMVQYYGKESGLTDLHEIQRYIKEEVDNPILFKHANHHTQGWKWIVAWFRKDYNMAFKYHWQFSLSLRNSWRLIDNQFKKDRGLIHRIMESRWSVRKSK